MKKNKILFLGFTVFLIAGLLSVYSYAKAGVTGAEGDPSLPTATVNVSPASATKNVGDEFDISVVATPEGGSIDTFQGKLTLNDNLACESVSMATDLLATLDNKLTCDDITFSLGIPKGTTSSKTLFTVKVKGISVGTGTATLSNLIVLSAGSEVASSASNGIYILTAAETTKTETTETTTEAIETTEKTSAKELPKTGCDNCNSLSLLMTIGGIIVVTIGIIVFLFNKKRVRV